MYCILITGIPAAGKTTMANALSERLHLPVISKDKIKELMFDEVGFNCREEKVKLGVASMEIMYYLAEQLMKCNQPFILENNFENSSKEGLMTILEEYNYTAITVRLTGDYEKIYERFAKRDLSPDRHRGHVVNDCYPEKEGKSASEIKTLPLEGFLQMIEQRGMDTFTANGPCIVVDNTQLPNTNLETVIQQIKEVNVFGGK